jgi:integrase
LGGGREALCLPGTKRGVTDPDLAEVLFEKRAGALREARLRGAAGLPQPATLTAFAAEHLMAKAKGGKSTDAWLVQCERHLKRAVSEFGGERELSTITTAAVRQWVGRLAAEGLSGSSQRHVIFTLSNLYRRAQSEGRVSPGYNPIAALLEKPSARREEARWLEVHQGALLLEAARRYRPTRADLGMPFAYPLIAAFLLTGGRRAEVLGLEVGDVSFDRKTVAFRENQWRRLKTTGSHRVVPLWPQLEQILRPYVFGDRPPARLLFPSFRTGEETMLTDFRKLLDAVAVRARWRAGEITPKMFRHTYASARLQTTDQGAPVSTFTVSRELGHGSESLVKRIYGHLGTVRHRAKVVEYRVEQHKRVLKERLAALRSGAGAN